MTVNQSQEIRFLVRADDIGSTHAANLGCVEAFRNGIARSVEIMATGPWFEEAVDLLQANPEYDVGVHLTLTSEWSGLKWRPLTHAPSLVDEDGYFFPTLRAGESSPPEKALMAREWALAEIEAEFRAQIELTRRKLPWVSHLSGHMGCSAFDEAVAGLTRRLASEYNLAVDPGKSGARRFDGWDRSRDFAVREEAFIRGIESMTPGLWFFVEHPGLDTPELQATGHPGYEDVALDRATVTAVMTSEKVKDAIRKKRVRLLGYRDLAPL